MRYMFLQTHRKRDKHPIPFYTLKSTPPIRITTRNSNPQRCSFASFNRLLMPPSVLHVLQHQPSDKRTQQYVLHRNSLSVEDDRMLQRLRAFLSYRITEISTAKQQHRTRCSLRIGSCIPSLNPTRPLLRSWVPVWLLSPLPE